MRQSMTEPAVWSGFQRQMIHSSHEAHFPKTLVRHCTRNLMSWVQ